MSAFVSLLKSATTTLLPWVAPSGVQAPKPGLDALARSGDIARSDGGSVARSGEAAKSTPESRDSGGISWPQPEAQAHQIRIDARRSMATFYARGRNGGESDPAATLRCSNDP